MAHHPTSHKNLKETEQSLRANSFVHLHRDGLGSILFDNLGSRIKIISELSAAGRAALKFSTRLLKAEDNVMMGQSRT